MFASFLLEEYPYHSFCQCILFSGSSLSQSFGETQNMQILAKKLKTISTSHKEKKKLQKSQQKLIAWNFHTLT